MDQKILGDYTIIKSIGQGTLGSVFLAEHRFMKKQYVLKVLPEELSSDRSFIQRFEDEVGILSSLEHSNIVKIHNISFAQGYYFLVTDCIVDELGETTNLAQYLLSLGRRLDEDEIYHILHQIADALDYAHNKKIGVKGLVHRGLKLNNILVGKGKGEIDIFLSDFGLSRVIGTGAVLTRIYKNVAESLGIVVQKPGQDRYPSPPVESQKFIPLHTTFLQNFAFLSPEQKRIDSSIQIDLKTDVFAFGVLAYYLLVNELPDGIFSMPSGLRELRYNWDHLIQKCLQFNPANRAEVLLETLEAVKTPVSQYSIPAEALNNCLARESIDEKADLAYAMNAPISIKETLSQETHEPTTLKPVIHGAFLQRPQADHDPGAAFQVDTSVKAYHPEPRDIANVKPILTDMIVIQGGTFYQGSQDGNRDEMPKHQVLLTSFAIDMHPVTNEQFVRFLEVMGGEKDSNHNDIIRLRDSRIKRSGGKLSIESGYSKHPVVGVTWYGAIAYAKWVGKRLPTEAEWEIAARGGRENTLYPSGEDIEKTQANFFSSDTTAVMSYAPNGYGLYDMAGNVYEWCHDWYGYNYYEIAATQEPENPQGPLQGVYRVLRGGCWKSLREDLRCSRRHRNNPGTVNGTYGFRCAADVL